MSGERPQDTSGASTSNQSAEEAVTSERLAESSRLLHLSDSEAWHEAVRAAARMSQPDQASLEHKLAGLRVIADIARSRALRRHERADEGDADVEGDPHSTDDIVTLGVVVAALVVCAEQFPRSEEVQALWTGILCNFAYSTTLPLPHDCRVAVAAILSCRGGVETVVAAMQRFPAHVMIQSNLAKALTMCLADIDVMPKTGGPPGSRVSQYSSTTSLILDSGIVEAVLASLGAMLLRPAQRSQATVGDGPPMCAAGPWDEARGAVFFLLRLVSGRHFSALRDRFLRRALLLGEEHAAAAAAAEAAGGGAGAAVAAAICQAIRLEVSLWAFAAAAGNPPPLRPLFVVSEFVDALVMLLIKSRQETEAAAAAAPRPPFARVLVRSKAPQQLLRLISSVLSSTHDPSTVSFDLLSGAVDLFEAVAVSAARDPSGLTLEPAILAEGVIVVSRLLMSLRPVALYVVEGSGKDSCPGVFNTYNAALAALRAVAAVPAARGWKIGESFSGPGSDAWGVQSGPEWNMTFLSVCTACRPLAGPTSAVEPKAVAALADLLHDFFAPLNVCAWRVDVILRTGLFSDVFKAVEALRQHCALDWSTSESSSSSNKKVPELIWHAPKLLCAATFVVLCDAGLSAQSGPMHSLGFPVPVLAKVQQVLAQQAAVAVPALLSLWGRIPAFLSLRDVRNAAVFYTDSVGALFRLVEFSSAASRNIGAAGVSSLLSLAQRPPQVLTDDERRGFVAGSASILQAMSQLPCEGSAAARVGDDMLRKIAADALALLKKSPDFGFLPATAPLLAGAMAGIAAIMKAQSAADPPPHEQRRASQNRAERGAGSAGPRPSTGAADDLMARQARADAAAAALLAEEEEEAAGRAATAAGAAAEGEGKKRRPRKKAALPSSGSSSGGAEQSAARAEGAGSTSVGGAGRSGGGSRGSAPAEAVGERSLADLSLQEKKQQGVQPSSAVAAVAGGSSDDDAAASAQAILAEPPAPAQVQRPPPASLGTSRGGLPAFLSPLRLAEAAGSPPPAVSSSAAQEATAPLPERRHPGPYQPPRASSAATGAGSSSTAAARARHQLPAFLLPPPSLVAVAAAAAALPSAGAGAPRQPRAESLGSAAASSAGMMMAAAAIDPDECCMCLDLPRSHALVPCGHVCVCGGCVEELVCAAAQRGDPSPLCPICREPFVRAIDARAARR